MAIYLINKGSSDAAIRATAGVGNMLTATILKNEKERVWELYWAKLPGLEQCRLLMLRPFKRWKD